MANIRMVYQNNFLGELVKGKDGFYVFFPRLREVGIWDGAMLHYIAEELDGLNEAVRADLEHWLNNN